MFWSPLNLVCGSFEAGSVHRDLPADRDRLRSVLGGQTFGVELVVEVSLEVWNIQDSGWIEVKLQDFFLDTFLQKCESAVQIADNVEDDFVFCHEAVSEDAMLSFLRIPR